MLEPTSLESPPDSTSPNGPYRAAAPPPDTRSLLWTNGLANVTLDSTSRRDPVEVDLGDAEMRVHCNEHQIRIAQAGSFWTRALDALLFGFDPELRARVGLHRDHAWSIECRGGVSELDASLADVRLTDLTIRGGVDRSCLVLGAPRGRVRVRIAGGANQLEIYRPPHVGLRLRVRGGVSQLTFDAMELESVGGKLALTCDDFGSCADFYDVEIRGGAHDLVLAKAEPRRAEP